MVGRKRGRWDDAPRKRRAPAGGAVDVGKGRIIDLSDECLLHILSFLDAKDVARAEGACARFARLGRASAVWRECFVREFVMKRGSLPLGAAIEPLLAHDASRKGRALATLPQRYQLGRGAVPSVQPDWRRLYLAWRNWHLGRVRVAALGDVPAPRNEGLPDTHASDTLVQASPNLVFTAPRTGARALPDVTPDALVAALPYVSVFLADAPSSERHLPLARLQPYALAEAIADAAQRDAALLAFLQKHGLALTEMRLEQTAEAWSVRLCLCFQPGVLAVLSVAVRTALEVHLDHVLLVHGAARWRPIRQAAFARQVLVTCTDDFRLQIWHVPPSGPPAMLRALRSSSSRWPASVALRPLASSAYQLSITYATPVRGAWTVTLQELLLRLTPAGLEVGSRVAHASAHANVHGRLPTITSISYDDPYIVIGTDTNVLDVYEVSHAGHAAVAAGRAASATPRPMHALGIRHLRTLYGHTSRVCSVALSDGRCVSGASDGSVRVWSMRQPPGEHVATLHGHVPTPDDRGLLVPLLPYAPSTRATTLAELAREPMHAYGVIKHVSAAFDHILCITAGRVRPAEQVQIWHFAS